MTSVFGVFSRRVKTSPTPRKRLTKEFRTRTGLALAEVLQRQAGGFWEEIRRKFAYLLGKDSLTGLPGLSYITDAMLFVERCSDEHFLDFLEYALASGYVAMDEQARLVRDFNHFLSLDDLPYAITEAVWTESLEAVAPFGPTPRRVSRLTSPPQIIIKDSQTTYALAIAPALTLLKRPEFATANTEFLEALADYKKGDHGDCLTKCGSAFESVLKIICDRNQWPYDQKHTASTLLDTVFAKQTSLEGFLKEPLILVATIRNRLSKSHGAGTTPKTVHPNRAEYALTATAAAILLLVSECT